MPACDQEPVRPTLGSSATEPGSAVLPPGAPASTRVSSARAAPRMKAYRSTETAKLGTLPDGVGVAVGEPAPVETVLGSQGQQVRLASLWGEQPVLLVFYRGGWCPFCNFQVRAFAMAHPRFDEIGVGLALVSVDRPEAADRTRLLHEIPFPVLSDAALRAHRAFRVTHQLSAQEAQRLSSRGMNVEESSGKTHHTIAIPAMFLIDQQGIVRFAHADRDYKTRPDIDALLVQVREALANSSD